VAQFRDEIFGRTLQTELSKLFLSPAFHVLTDRRGKTLVFSSATPDIEAFSQRLTAIPWPATAAIASGQLQKVYVQLDQRLFLTFGIPLRVEIGNDWAMVYFVAYEINDAWVKALLPPAGDTPLRVVVQLGGATIARSTAAPDATESAIARQTASLAHSSDLESVPVDFESRGEHYVGEALLVPSADTNALFAFYSSLDQALVPLRKLQHLILLLTLGVIALAILISQLMSRMLAKPVEQLVAGTERIARGDFKVPIDTRRSDELGTLARSFNQMAAGLEQRDLIKDTFGKFVDPSIVQSMLDDPTRLRLGGERRVQTILFADLENFTAIAERLEPEALFRLLNGYLEDAADVVAEHRGIVDKFIGDGVVAFWGPPLEENHAASACRAALELARRTTAHDELCSQLQVPPLRVRVGIATGEVLVGNIGSRSKYNYTVMGDGANLASRLEGVNKLYGTQILATSRTASEAADAIAFRRIDTVRVIGRLEPVELFEVLGEIASGTNGNIAAYHDALELYRSRRFDDARAAFDRIDDAPSRAMAGRCAVLLEHDPGPAWDGVWNLDRK
jgi:class 3 adenylate cyclase